MARAGLRVGNVTTPEASYAQLTHTGAGGNAHLDTITGALYLNWNGGSQVVVGNGAAGVGQLTTGNIIANGGTPGALNATGITAINDVATYRPSSSNTGVVYLNASVNRYLFYDGTNYQMPGASLYVNGIFVNSAGWAKEAVRPVEPGILGRVRAVAPQFYRWADQPAATPDNVGFVREDVAAQFPGSTGADLVGANRETVPGGYRADHLVAYLWQAVRELAAEVDELKQRTAA
jgi:hypothetical protein